MQAMTLRTHPLLDQMKKWIEHQVDGKQQVHEQNENPPQCALYGHEPRISSHVRGT
jgi:hypothetical protein